MSQDQFNQSAIPDTNFSARAVEELTAAWQKSILSIAVKNLGDLKGQKFSTTIKQGWEAGKAEIGVVSAPIMKHSVVFHIITTTDAAVTTVIEIKFYKDERGQFMYSLTRPNDADTSVLTTSTPQGAINFLAMLRRQIADVYNLNDMEAVILRKETTVAAAAPSAPTPTPKYEGGR